MPGTRRVRRSDPARCAGVVRRPVVLLARCAKRARVPGVVQMSARCAGVIRCWCGAVMRDAGQGQWPARPTPAAADRCAHEIGDILTVLAARRGG
jgi:hypothetical protein